MLSIHALRKRRRLASFKQRRKAAIPELRDQIANLESRMFQELRESLPHVFWAKYGADWERIMQTGCVFLHRTKILLPM
jgi:hypothetical protein